MQKWEKIVKIHIDGTCWQLFCVPLPLYHPIFTIVIYGWWKWKWNRKLLSTSTINAKLSPLLLSLNFKLIIDLLLSLINLFIWVTAKPVFWSFTMPDRSTEDSISICCLFMQVQFDKTRFLLSVLRRKSKIPVKLFNPSPPSWNR